MVLSDYANDLLFRTYEASIRYVFKYHPRCDYIIEALKTNQLTIGEIDILFAEAESYSWQHFMSLKTPEPDENGMVTFKINRGKDGQ